ncbi:phage/plasmid primase, P4 family [Marinobacter sp.]|uniref:DNA primase family protein n=1 Tax=Marinobacter sp. TaxID=50741 RepID=UPI003566E175
MTELERITPAPVAAGNEGKKTYQSADFQDQYTETDQKVNFTVWLDKSGKTKSDKAVRWPEFCQWMQDLPPARVKDACKLIKLASFGDARTEKGSLRHDANVIEVTGIEGDYDSEEMTPEQAVELLERHNLKAAIAPTFSAGPDAPRWRVLTPLTAAIKPADRLRYVEILNGMLGGVLARESATLSQSYFIGVPAGAPYTVIHTFDDPEEGLTLDELDGMEGLDQLRQPLGKATEKGSDGPVMDFGGGQFDDWVKELCSGEAVHPNAIKIAGRCVAKGWGDQEIRTLFAGLADRVELQRGKERGDLLRGKELDDAIASARAKGYAPREYAEILADAQKLTKESDADVVDKLVAETIPLKAIQKRQIRQVIKRATGLPFSVMEEAERACFDEDEGADDLQLARALVQEIGQDNVMAADTFVWQWRDTGVWQKQEDRTVKQWVQHHLAENAEGVKKSLVDSVTDLFRTEIFKPHHIFDIGPPECVNTLNGELVLMDGQWHLLPHDREHYRTTQIPVEYDPKAQAPRFVQFMAEVFKDDPDAGDKAQALLEMIGYTLMAHCRHEKFIILVGSGANGKSVLLSVLEALAGSENVAGVQPSQFDRSFQRAHLHGKLANIVTEIKQGEMIDDASLKGIVSGEPTTVEHKFRDPFVMRPYATCWFGTNHMPHTRDFSDALFRRALVVEFNNKFKPELGNCDPQLKDKLMEELPGILSLALDAYADALTHSFTMPDSCRQAREQWRLEADQVAQFVEAECQDDPDGKVKPQPLFNAYRQWADENGIHKRLTQRSFGDRLVALGYGRTKSDGERYHMGLKCQRAVIGAFVR